ncbi:hypothetical protein HNP99_003141 [Flavobacterium sp. 28A]|uniref:hypothetical protein n=1 Tax=Flavobacterium sp. 28A TaxID=2735895 RepID=UPI00157045EE|nr:hypothetical protein [Flavobacterium sp. 28A]NRT16768.1 hypothetical protein [Flavobacterium sp. 28A]
MISIITGDIINSRKTTSTEWILGLKQLLNTLGNNPEQWEIYRGDEFQLEVATPTEALHHALLIKAYLKSIKLDARMSIGFGEKNYAAKKISESNGSAFIRSGELFDTLKKQKNNLAINTSVIDFDEEINLMLRLGLTFMDNWLAQSAELVLITLQNPTLSQDEIGQLLNINQAAVSRRRSRAKFDLVLELDDYFRKKIKNITV